MASVQERLQLKREPLDKWSLREQLCLASAVLRSGDQNWMSVSRALKPFGEANRPSDWFHQKNCAAQYNALLANVETPKRKKRSGSETVVETPAECILRKLSADRQAELKSLLAEEKAEYKKLQEDMKLLHSGKISEEQLDIWCKEIDEEEAKREQETINHAKWLKQRDLRKQEIERSWNPLKPSFSVTSAKRKTPDDSIDSETSSQIQEQNSNAQYQQQYVSSHQQSPQKLPPLYHQVMGGSENQSQQQTIHMQQQESARPALSPLLTSLLKSPSQVQNLSPVSTTILHNAITSQSSSHPGEAITSVNSSISNIFNASTNAPVVEQFPNVVSQETSNDEASQPLDADLLDDANIKIDDLAKSILVQDGPFPEIRKEEVDDIISEIIENAHDIVADPDQHLELDGNGEININLELDEFDQEGPMDEEPPKKETSEEVKVEQKSPAPAPVIDPFEFQEDPVLFESPVKPSSLKQENAQYVPLYQQSPIKSEEKKSSDTAETGSSYSYSAGDRNQLNRNVHGSVEIVEVPAEEQGNEKELNKAQIRDIVHSIKEKAAEGTSPNNVAASDKDETQVVSDNILDNEVEIKDEPVYFDSNKDDNNSDSNVASVKAENEGMTDFSDDLYDNINMELKIDKTGKAKRDYSRPKKKEEKSFDMLLAIEKAHFDDISDDMGDYKIEGQQKEILVPPPKSETDRSASPWTEEEEGHLKASKRRYSTPVTPLDSLPNSPASSTAFYDDDRDHKNWKKSVMLVYNRLASNRYASLFLKPITEDQAPGYSTVVYRPMDLQTIKKNIDNGIIRNSLEFKRDVMLMFTNAIMFNKTNSTIYNMAIQMQQESMNPIEILLQAERQVDAPLRRETRTSESNCKRKRLSDDFAFKNKKKKED